VYVPLLDKSACVVGGDGRAQVAEVKVAALALWLASPIADTRKHLWKYWWLGSATR